METLEQKILRFQLEKEEKERIENYIKSLNEKIKKTIIEIDDLSNGVLKEQEDVEKKEKRSYKGIFSKILGDGDKGLEVEKQEVLWAFMSLDKAKESLELLKYEKSVLLKKLLNFEYEETVLKELLIQKERLLKNDPQMRIKLTLIDSHVESFNKQKKEIEEVLGVADELMKLFHDLFNELRQISNWNQAAYSYYGRGHYSSFKKKKYIERNIKLLPKIEICIEKLYLELKDLKVKYKLDITINLTLLNNFFIIFLDNLITDWVVRTGIISSLNMVETSKRKIESLERVLVYELKLIDKALFEKKKLREETILKGNL